jgi:hypothetical protein
VVAVSSRALLFTAQIIGLIATLLLLFAGVTHLGADLGWWVIR